MYTIEEHAITLRYYSVTCPKLQSTLLYIVIDSDDFAIRISGIGEHDRYIIYERIVHIEFTVPWKLVYPNNTYDLYHYHI